MSSIEILMSRSRAKQLAEALISPDKTKGFSFSAPREAHIEVGVDPHDFDMVFVLIDAEDEAPEPDDDSE